MGAQRRMNIRKVKALLRSFREGATITAACKAADVSRNTLWLWCRYWPNLNKRIEEIKSCRVGYVVDAVYINAMNGKEASQKLYLSINGMRTGEGVKVEVPVKIQNATSVNIPVASEEERARVKRCAELIVRHNLVSRALGEEGHQSVLGEHVQGQQGGVDQSGANPPGDACTH